MRLLVDAQLPMKLVDVLNRLGQDALHVSQIPGGTANSDRFIADYCDQDSRILVSKDYDFVDSHLIGLTPLKLIWVSVGNCRVFDLITLFENNIDLIERHMSVHNFLQLSRAGISFHA